MKAASEHFKGIYYIQISALPTTQKNEILKSLRSNQIIKILRTDSLLRDCVQYQHYENWYENIFVKTLIVEKETVTEDQRSLIPVSNFQSMLSAQ